MVQQILLLLIINIIINKTYSLVYKPSSITYQQSYNQDEFQSVWDISLRKNKDFDQVYAYSYGFWLKWSFVYPKIIDQQEQWYSICRLTSRENHSDYSHPQDRDLSIWMSKEFFHFTTYTIDYPEKFYNVNFTKEQLDGIWNFVYFGYNYDESLARGYILFNQGQFQEALIPAKHFKQQYIRFLIKREFQNKAFNGYFSNIFLSINENPLKSQQDILKLVQQKNCLLSNLNQIFQQQILIDSQQEVIYDESKFQQFYYKDIDPSQFSVSGWLKFENPVEFKDSNFVVRLSHNQKGDEQQWYDKIMFLKSIENNYQFETYDCEFDCRILDWQIKTENQDKLWHFVYMAFDQNQRKIFQFWKFDQQAFIILKEQIYHYQIHGLYLNLQKDDFTPGYNGQMKRWTFNYGNGAYREDGFEDDTLLQQNIGLKSFLTLNQTELWKFQQNDLDIDYQNNQDLQENEIDPSSFKIDSNEYGYGFWMKFIYNKQSSKINSLTNKTLGVSRFGTVQQYKQKNNLGQNTLSILLQTNKIIFQTYTILDENQKDFQIQRYLDNQWLYVYNGYKRVYEKQGVLLGCVFDEKGMQSCIQSQNDIVHFKIEDFIFFSIGSIGIKQQDYLHFNGFIKDAKLYFGTGSIYPKYHEFQHETIPCNQNWITKVVQQYNVDRLDYNPSDFKLTDYIDEYSIQLWFKNQGNNEVDDQYVFTLSHDEIPQSKEVSGGLVLGTKVNKQNNIFILSQTFNEEDYFSLIEKEIQIVKEQDIKQWTYLYVAYKDKNCYYFIQTKTQRFNQIFDCIHQSSNHYYLFKGSDGQNNKFLGDLDYLKVDFGQGSFLTEFNFLSESFKMGLKLFPTTFKWKQSQKIFNLSFNKLNLAQNFKTNDKISMDGQKNYGYGFWSRFLTEFPSIFINEDNFIIISSLLSNQVQKKELEIISLYLSPDKSQYKIKTYDLNQKKYKFGTFDFQSSQEGIWNYIYVSYSADLKQLVGFIHHQQEKRVMRIILNDIYHNSINGNVDFILGKYFNFPGFNGQISNILVNFDGDSFIDQISSFQEIILSNQLSLENEQYQQFGFIKLNQKAQFFEQQINLKEDYLPTEYSIFGWFRPNLIEKISNSINANVISESEKFEYQILKLISNNNQIDQYRNRFNIKITQNGYQFSTYSIVQDSPASSWLQNILLNPNFGTWCYFWMGYSEKLQQVSVYFKILEQTETKIFYEIKHFLANFFQIILSSINQDAFDGDYSQIGMEIGEGSFKNKNDQLPEYSLNLEDQAFNYQNLNGDFENVNRLNLIEGKNNLIGSTEYSVYLWARWLHEISDNSFLDQNNLFRLARTIKYEDCEDQGDRILIVQITNQYYSFFTYDVEETQCSIYKNINYENMLEGQWNFIYFGYQNQVNYFGAKGYIYFSKSQIIKEIEFKIEHIPLANAAVLSLGQNEFSYGKFYGQMYQVMVTIGYGFIQDHSKLLECTSLPEKDLNGFLKNNLIQQESSLDQLQNTQYKILVQLQDQYSVFGWFKVKQFTEFGKFSVLIRISSNPELKGDLGDDTLVILINDKTIQFRSYSYIPVNQNNQAMNEVIKNIDFIENQNSQWAFFYYGYNFNSNQLLIFLKFNEDLHEYQEKIDYIYHYLPLEFYAFIGQDNIYSKYYGLMDDFNFLVGESSYIEQNIYKTYGSLNRKYVENVLK